MKLFFTQLMGRTRRALWTIIVAYMLGIHNFYKGEDKTPDTIGIIAKVKEVRDDGASKK